MKFGTDVMPQINTRKSYFLIFTFCNTIMTDAETREVERWWRYPLGMRITNLTQPNLTFYNSDPSVQM
jgi:hypothetical protein